MCILALLIGLYASINLNITSYNTEKVSAITSPLNADSSPSAKSGSDGSSDVVEPSLSLTINGNPNEATPVNVNEVAYRSNTFTVSATKYKDYMVVLSAMNGSGSELHGRNNPHAVIGGVGTSVAPADFASNTWGYAATSDLNVADSSLLYNTIPAFGYSSVIVPKHKLSQTTESNMYKIVFAAKIGADSPEDHYEGQLLMSLIGTPEQVTGLGFGGVTTMQEFTTELCRNNVSIGEEGLLEDTRVNADGDTRVYHVAKINDHGCWMTQNLDYDGGGARREQSADWQGGTNDQYHVAEYYDPGMYYFMGDEILKNACGSLEQCQKAFVWVSEDAFENLVATVKLTDSTSFKQATQYVGTDGQTFCNKTAGVPYGDIWSDNTVCRVMHRDFMTSIRQLFQDTHRTIGNYYSFEAAVHGNICPENWKLPTRQESILFAPSGTAASTLIVGPYYLVPAGFENYHSIDSLGAQGRFWLGEVDTTKNYGYQATFTSTVWNINSSSFSRTDVGLSGRCMIAL